MSDTIIQVSVVMTQLGFFVHNMAGEKRGQQG